MDGAALNWLQCMHNNGQIISWQNLVHTIQIRFVLSHFNDRPGSLFKLTQTSSVKEYQTQFELLSNCISGLPPQFSLTCFVFGLKRHIRREVQALQLLTLVQAIGLAKIQEESVVIYEVT